jgi:hypothetical protein
MQAPGRQPMANRAPPDSQTKQLTVLHNPVLDIGEGRDGGVRRTSLSLCTHVDHNLRNDTGAPYPGPVSAPWLAYDASRRPTRVRRRRAPPPGP